MVQSDGVALIAVLNNALVSRSEESFNKLSSSISFLQAAIVKHWNDEEELEPSLQLIGSVRDLLSLCLDVETQNLAQKGICLSFLRDLRKSSFLEKSFLAIDRLRLKIDDVLSGKCEVSSASLDGLRSKRLFISECIFQYCNGALDLTTEEQAIVIRNVKAQEDSFESGLVVFGLISYLGKARVDLQPAIQKESWTAVPLRDVLLFANSCIQKAESLTSTFISESGVFEWIQQFTTDIVGRVIGSSDDFFRFVAAIARDLFVKLMLLQPKVIRTIRQSQQEGKGNSFNQLLSIFTCIYRVLPEFSIDFWDREGRLNAFLRWSIEAPQPSTLSVYLDLLDALSQNKRAAKANFDLIADNGSLGIVSINLLFTALARYAAVFSAAKHVDEIAPQEYKVLVSFLKLAATLALNVPEARDSLFTPAYLNPLISLLKTSVRTEFKVRIATLLQSFCIDDGKREIIAKYLKANSAVHSLINECQALLGCQLVASVLPLCEKLASDDQSLVSLVLAHVFCTLPRYKSAQRFDGSWLIAGRCLKVFLEAKGPIRAFKENFLGCANILMNLFSSDRDVFRSSTVAECQFLAARFTHFLCRNDESFLNAMLARSSAVVDMFSLLDRPINAETAAYLVDLLRICCENSPFFAKTSQFLSSFHSEGAKNNPLFLGMTRILSISVGDAAPADLPAIEKLTSWHSEQIPQSSLWQFTKKLLLQIIARNVSKGCGMNLFADLLSLSVSFIGALCDLVVNSAATNVSIVDEALRVLVSVVESPMAEHSFRFLRHLRSTLAFPAFLQNSLFSSGKEAAKFSLDAYASMLRILAAEIHAMDSSNFSTESLRRNISPIELLELIRRGKNNARMLDSIVHFLSTVTAGSSAFVSNEMQQFFQSSIPTVVQDFLNDRSISESSSLVFVLCRLIHVAAPYIQDEKYVRSFFTSQADLSSPCRAALYAAMLSCKTSRLPLSGAPELWAFLTMDCIAVENPSLQILAIAILESNMEPEVTRWLSRNGHLASFVKEALRSSKDTALLSLLQAIASCNPQSLVDAGIFEESVTFLRRLRESFPPGTPIERSERLDLVMLLLTECLLVVPGCVDRIPVLAESWVPLLQEFLGSSNRSNGPPLLLLVAVSQYQPELCRQFFSSVTRLFGSFLSVASTEGLDTNATLLNALLSFQESCLLAH